MDRMFFFILFREGFWELGVGFEVIDIGGEGKVGVSLWFILGSGI